MDDLRDGGHDRWYEGFSIPISLRGGDLDKVKGAIVAKISSDLFLVNILVIYSLFIDTQ